MTDVAIEPDEDNGADAELIRRPLHFALGMCAGACMYYAFAVEPASVSFVGACLLVLAAGVCGLNSNRVPILLRAAIVFCCGAAAAALVAKVHTLARSSPAIVETIGPAMVEGWITDIEPGQNGNRLNIAVHAISGVAHQAQPDRIRLTHTNRLEVQTGRFVRCYAVIRPPPQAELPGDYQSVSYTHLTLPTIYSV